MPGRIPTGFLILQGDGFPRFYLCQIPRNFLATRLVVVGFSVLSGLMHPKTPFAGLGDVSHVRRQRVRHIFPQLFL
jgi:hypothetical protein